MSNLPQPKPIPATIGAIFGGLWALIAAFALPSAWRLPVSALAVLVTVALIAMLWRADAPAADNAPLFRRRPYHVAVGAEMVLIYAASVILPRMGLQPYFIQVVGFIVGLHFIGLWVATRSVRFVYIALAMCFLSAVAIAFPDMAGPFRIRDFFTGSGNALVLWIGSGLFRNA